jgi:hypothetical protein
MTVPTYATLINQKIVVPSARTHYVAVDKDHFVEYLRLTLDQVYVDSDWYVRCNPDIAFAITSRIFADAKQHYVTCGYYEHRIPYEISVDELWYLEHYEDVGEAVEKGLFSGAREHFYLVGYREGRLPHANFTLREVA